MSSTPRQTRRGPKISFRVVLLATVGLFLAALVTDGALALLTVRDRLERVAEALGHIEPRVVHGELGSAADLADQALAEADRAYGATRRPSFFIASFIPRLREEADAIGGVVEAAGLSASAARSVVDGASTLGVNEEGAPEALYRDGQIRLPTVSTSREQINQAEVALTNALVRLEGLNPELDQLREAVGDAHGRIKGALARITDARTLMDLLPRLFGSDERRRYLLAFQTPAEARATGGLIGFVGVLTADDGKLNLDELGPGAEFFAPRYPRVEAPQWFRENYASQGALEEWQQVNTTPSHDVMSRVLLDMYERTNDVALDGLLSMDPIAMRYMMSGIDPIRVRGRVIDESNVVDVILRDSYLEFSPEEQNVFLTDAVDAFWDEVASGDVDLKPFADGLGKAFRSQHLKLFGRRGGDQDRIETLGLDGDYNVGPNSQMAFNVNYGANKLDYYLRRTIETRIQLRPGGDAIVTTNVRLKNQAPADAVPGLFYGDGEELRPGVNRMTINLLLPPGAVVQTWARDGRERTPRLYMDQESPVVWDMMSVTPGRSRTVSVTYHLPAAIQALDDRTTFDFSLYPQATVNPDSFSLRIEPPPGVRVVASDGELSDEAAPSMSGALEEPVSVRLIMDEG